jgi:ABC-type branched-subunit amino acid transport system ATPase component/ABC-type branched-subunit amino acid transport system permease subunit
MRTHTIPFLRDRWHLLILILAIIIFPLVSQSYFVTRLGVVLAIYGIGVAGVTLLTRCAGIVSLGQAAFFAMGAYISGLLCVKLGLNPWLSMVIAAAATTAIAYLFSVPFLKLRATILAMATLGLGSITGYVAVDWHEVTNGMSGLAGIPYLSIGPFVLRTDWSIFYLAGIFLIAFAFMVENIGRTRLGRAYHAIRTNETAAMAAGVNVQKNMVNVFCFTACITSLAGSLLAYFITYISPDSFTLNFSFTLLIIVIIGGANIWASLVTGVILLGLSEVFRGVQNVSLGLYAGLLITALFLFPEGLSAVLFPASRASRKKAAGRTELQKEVAAEGEKVDLQPHKRKEGIILEASDISMYYGGTTALSGVSLSVEYGQIVGVIGPNGAGKTTLMNVLNGYLKPAGGTITFQDRDVTKSPPHTMARLGAARTFQLINLYSGMTVIDNVMVGCHLKGSSGIIVSGLNLKRAREEEKEIWETAVRSLRIMGLMDRAYDIVDTLSFGEQRAVELARALAMEPDLVFLDEPAAGLNTAEAKNLAVLLRRIRDAGIAILLVEHNMSLVMSVSDMVCVLDFGRRIAFGPPEVVSKDEEVIRAYLGQEAERAPDQPGETGKAPSRVRGHGQDVLLDVQNITAGYDSLVVLRDVSFGLEKGETLAVIGPNGAGKTTLLWALSGLLKPKVGRVALAGQDITGLDTYGIVRTGIGHVHSGMHVFSSLNVEDNLMLGAYGLASSPEKMQSVFKYFPVLEKRRRQAAGSLSGGEKQMLAIGLALMTDTRLLLLDEPSAGLAPMLVRHLFEILDGLRNELRLTILLVEQNAEVALRFADRGLVLSQGRIRLEGEASALIKNEEVQRIYLGGQ